jgi:hypothetical protein
MNLDNDFLELKLDTMKRVIELQDNVILQKLLDMLRQEEPKHEDQVDTAVSLEDELRT